MAARFDNALNYGTLFAEHYDRACRYARSLARDACEADDLVADSFASVLEILRRGMGPDEQSFWPYLRHTIRNRFAKKRQHEARERLTDTSALETVGANDALSALVEEGETEHREQVMVRAFRRLPPNHRIVLLITAVDRGSAADAAMVLGCTPNAATALAHRARRKLRTLYRDEAGHGQIR